MLRSSVSLDAVHGCLLGGAVGDALGAPFEGLWSSSIPQTTALLQEYEEYEGFPRGQFTDDTQLVLATVGSIVDQRAVVYQDIANRISELWPNEIIGPGGACTIAAMNFRRTRDWRRSGAPAGHAGNGAAMRTAAVGLVFVNDPSALPMVVANISRITHKDPLGIAGGIAVSRASLELAINTRIDSDALIRVIAADVAPFSEEFARAIKGLTSILNRDDDDVRLALSSSLNPSYEFDTKSIITPYVVPTVLAALWTTLRNLDSWPNGVATAIQWGGDTDTLASIVGSLLGSHLGWTAIPKHLVTGVRHSQDIQDLADRYHGFINHPRKTNPAEHSDQY